MIIGIDIDDTLSCSHDTMFAYAERYIVDELKRTIQISNDNDLGGFGTCERVHMLSDEEADKMWKNCFLQVIKDSPAKPLAKEIIDKLREEGNKIIIISARYDMDGKGSVLKYTKEWFENHQIKYDKLIFSTPDKLQTIKDEKVDVFIDDAAPTCLDVAKLGVKVLMMDSIENQLTRDNSVTRVYSWVQAYQEINNYKV